MREREVAEVEDTDDKTDPTTFYFFILFSVGVKDVLYVCIYEHDLNRTVLKLARKC